MERPGFESPLCALSTNRSLSATIRKLPLDRCAFFHRRMTHLIFDCGIRKSSQCKPQDPSSELTLSEAGGSQDDIPNISYPPNRRTALIIPPNALLCTCAHDTHHGDVVLLAELLGGFRNHRCWLVADLLRAFEAEEFLLLVLRFHNAIGHECEPVIFA